MGFILQPNLRDRDRTLVEKIYHTGVKLTKVAMEKVEEQLERFPDLKKWFVSIPVNFD